MTRTDPPDLLVSTVYQDIQAASLPPAQSAFGQPLGPCDISMAVSLENQSFNKRHCRSFDFLESLDEPPPRPPAAMERPSQRLPTSEPSSAAAPVSRRTSARAAAPEGYVGKPSPRGREVPKESAPRVEPKRRTRSKSAPRVKSTFAPVVIPIASCSPPAPTRRSREAQRVSRELSPRREVGHSSMKALIHEVHPIKLQPQRSSGSRISPLCVSGANCYEEVPAMRPVPPSVHVKRRMDIKPDEATVMHAACSAKALHSHMEVPPPWPKPPGTAHSLTVPGSWQVSMSRTPTPSDTYSGEHRVLAPYPTDLYDGGPALPEGGCIPFSSYVPTKFFYTEEPGSFPLKSSGYGGYPPHYGGHVLPPQPFYADEPPHSSFHAVPTRTFFMEDNQSYPVQEAPTRTYYGEESPPFYAPSMKAVYTEDSRAYPAGRGNPRVFCTEDYGKYHQREAMSRTCPHPRNTQPMQFNDWHCDRGALPYQTWQMSRLPPHQPGPRAMLSPWHASYSASPPRLGTDTRPFSKSWDNILTPHVRAEDPVLRGRSYENLLARERHRALSPEDRRQPVVVNLSSSPKRYAALSLSENSLIEKMHADGVGRHGWFVTPEITITDNDIRANGLSKNDRRSASWDVLDSGNVWDRGCIQTRPYIPAPGSQESAARQHSLEQLDELITDLVIDYKPPSICQASDVSNLAEQLRRLISEGMALPAKKPEPWKELDSRPTKEQPGPSSFHAELRKDQGRRCAEVTVSTAGLMEKPSDDCSPDVSADEDDVMMCSNAKCRRTETMFNACLYFKSCHSCYTYYCSRNCRREDWDTHKESCIYGRIGSTCRHVLQFCRENGEVHKAFSRIAKVGFLSRGRGVLFLGFPNPGSAENFLQFGLESLLMSPTYLSMRELEGYSDNLGEYARELREAGQQYDPDECFLLNITVAVGQKVPDRPSPKVQVPTVRKYAKIALASTSPEKKIFKKERDMETLILTPPPGTADIDKGGEEGRKAREVCFIHIQRELRIRGVFLRHEFPKIYEQLCDFVERNKRFTPTTIYPIDKRTGKQFMCMIMAASEPRTLDWVASPNLLEDLM